MVNNYSQISPQVGSRISGPPHDPPYRMEAGGQDYEEGDWILGGLPRRGGAAGVTSCARHSFNLSTDTCS